MSAFATVQATPVAGRSPATNSQSPGPVRWIIACAVLLAIAIMAGTATFLSSFRDRLLHESQRELTSTALILSTQIESFLKAVEKVQKEVLDHLVDIENHDSEARESSLSGYDLHLKLRDQAAYGVRFTSETDSINASVLGPDAAPGSPEFDAYVKQLLVELTTKAGQKCTAIRRAIVPEGTVDALCDLVGYDFAIPGIDEQ